MAEDKDTEQEATCLHVDKYMIPAKVSYFFQNGKNAIVDYLMLFYTSTGLTPSEAGLVNGLQYIGGVIGNPLWGYVADKTQHHRVIVWFLCFMAVVTLCVQPIIGGVYSPESNICPTNRTSTSPPIHVHERTSLFYSLLVAAILASSFDSTVDSFVDTGVLLRVRTCPGGGANIGMQRYAGSIGRSFASVMFSISMGYFPHGALSCYVGLFVTYYVFNVCTGVSAHFLYKDIVVMTEKEDGGSTNSLLWEYVKYLDSLLFFFSVLLNGVLQSLYFSFLFLYLKTLHAPTLLLGFSITFNTVSAVTVYVFSERIIRTLRGPSNAMCFTTFMWGLRFLCTASLISPYVIFIIDIFHGFTYSLFRVSYLKYVNETADERICTTVCGIANALYKCCSFLLANIVGGKLYEIYGPKCLFNGAAALSFGWTMINIVYIFVKKRRTLVYDQLHESDSDTDAIDTETVRN